MSLKERLLQDMKDAMKEKDTVRKNTVQLVRSGILQIEKDKKIELDDEGVLDVISKELKKRLFRTPNKRTRNRFIQLSSKLPGFFRQSARYFLLVSPAC